MTFICFVQIGLLSYSVIIGSWLFQPDGLVLPSSMQVIWVKEDKRFLANTINTLSPPSNIGSYSTMTKDSCFTCMPTD